MGSSTQSKSGVISKAYLPLDAKRFVPQGYDPTTGAALDQTRRLSAGPADLCYFPTLIDAFGQPILAWAADEVPAAGTNTIAFDNSTNPRLSRPVPRQLGIIEPRMPGSLTALTSESKQ